MAPQRAARRPADGSSRPLPLPPAPLPPALPRPRDRAGRPQARLLVLPVPQGERRRPGELRAGVGEEEQRRPADDDGAVEGVHAEDHGGHRGQGHARRRRVRRGRAARPQPAPRRHRRLQEGREGQRRLGRQRRQVHARARRQGPPHPLRLPGLHARRPRGHAEGGRHHEGAGDVGRDARAGQEGPEAAAGVRHGPARQQPDRLGHLGRHHEELRRAPRRRPGQEGRLRRLQGRGVGVHGLLRRGVEVGRAAPGRGDLGQHDEQLDVPGGQGGVHPEPGHRLAVAGAEQPRAARQDRALHVSRAGRRARSTR